MGNVEYNPVVVSLQSDISLTLGNSRWPGVERALKLSPRSNIRVNLKESEPALVTSQ